MLQVFQQMVEIVYVSVHLEVYVYKNWNIVQIQDIDKSVQLMSNWDKLDCCSHFNS